MLCINKADRPANSRERWTGALMEVRSLFGLNSTVKRGMDHGLTDRPMDGWMDRRTDPYMESLVSD